MIYRCCSCLMQVWLMSTAKQVVTATFTCVKQNQGRAEQDEGGSSISVHIFVFCLIFTLLLQHRDVI